MASEAEIAASLSIEDVPIKLRCAACNKVAINAFRMPCCDQNICGDCQESLPEACPICLHEPISKDDCRPNKALRMTIKALLKTKGQQREALRKKEAMERAAAAAAAAPQAPATPPSEQSLTQQHPEAGVADEDPAQSANTGIKQEPESDPTPLKAHASDSMPADAQKDVPQESIESPGPQGRPRTESTYAAGDGSSVQENPNDQESADQYAQGKADAGSHQSANTLNGFNVEGLHGMNGGFPNMVNIGNMGMGEYQQMMQMMQGGMPNNILGGLPNMMGMPGMSMDPLAMQQMQGMYGGFGGPGMSMNGMNSMNGMSMGMGFDAGQGAFGGFVEQPQAFNQNSYGGQNSFGANAGYGGYNMPQHQGNFNQHQNFNDNSQHGYHNQGFYPRGRGRGRGFYPTPGRGRGGFGQQGFQGRQANTQNQYSQDQQHRPHQMQQAHQQQAQDEDPPQNGRRGSPVYTPMNGAEAEQPPKARTKSDDASQTKQTNKTEDINGDAKAPDGFDTTMQAESQMDALPEATDEARPDRDDAQDAVSSPREIERPVPIPSVLSEDAVEAPVRSTDTNTMVPSSMPPPSAPVIPTGPALRTGPDGGVVPSPRGRGFSRGFSRITSDYRNLHQGRGAITPVDGPSRPRQTPPVQAPVVPKGVGVEGAPKGPKALLQGLPNVGYRSAQEAKRPVDSRVATSARHGSTATSTSQAAASARSPSHSPSRHKSSHRSHRHRTNSPEKDREREKRRERHERRPREDDDDYEERRDDRREKNKSAYRDISAHSSTRRSSHRSHRDPEKESSRSKHRSHRSHRDRTRSPEDDYRSHKRRSITPEFRINGASRLKENQTEVKASRSKHADEDSTSSSRKRRDREDESHHDRKRSRRNEEDMAEDLDVSHRSKHGRREERASQYADDRTSKTTTRVADKTSDRTRSPALNPPKGPKLDQHALEREARDRERQMKEIQRRALMEGGKGSAPKAKANGRVGERKISYKYEDEDLDSRVEKERERGRWK